MSYQAKIGLSVRRSNFLVWSMHFCIDGDRDDKKITLEMLKRKKNQRHFMRKTENIETESFSTQYLYICVINYCCLYFMNFNSLNLTIKTKMIHHLKCVQNVW